jgi:hypothetical protein
VEQDHRAIKRRINACLGFRSFDGAQRTIQRYEAMNMIRKGQVRWLAKGRPVTRQQKPFLATSQCGSVFVRGVNLNGRRW